MPFKSIGKNGNWQRADGMFAQTDSLDQPMPAPDSENSDSDGFFTGNVVSMRRMFYDADSFNQDISSWDVQNVELAFDFSDEAGLKGDSDSAWTEAEHPFYRQVIDSEGEVVDPDLVNDSDLEIPTGALGNWQFVPPPPPPPPGSNLRYPLGNTETDPTNNIFRGGFRNRGGDTERRGLTNPLFFANAHQAYFFFPNEGIVVLYLDSDNGRVFLRDETDVEVFDSNFDMSDPDSVASINLNPEQGEEISTLNSEQLEVIRTLPKERQGRLHTMRSMFQNNSNFNDSDISLWDTSGVVDMSYMFWESSAFNCDLSSWDVSSVTDMRSMFEQCGSFNNGGSDGIRNWDVSNVGIMVSMFEETVFNQPLDRWDTSSVRRFDRMFFQTFFNQDIDTKEIDGVKYWDMSNAISIASMFHTAHQFNQDLNNWELTSLGTVSDAALGVGATAASGVFRNARSFNGNISDWDVSRIVNFNTMFDNAHAFNQDISNWNVSNASSMVEMFRNTTVFNQDIGGWDVSSVTNMDGMFENANAFNQPIGDWDTSRVTNMRDMFRFALAFNQPLGDWDVSNVTNMNDMFRGTENFNQDLTSWCVPQFSQAPFGFDAFATGWLNPLLRPVWGVCGSNMMNVNYPFSILTEDVTHPNWRARHPEYEFHPGMGYYIPQPFTDASEMFMDADIPGDGISRFERSIYVDLSQWDTSQVTTMRAMFRNSTLPVEPRFNTSSVTDMSYMFSNFRESGLSRLTLNDSDSDIARADNVAMRDWNTSSVTNMSHMFDQLDGRNEFVAGIGLLFSPSIFSDVGEITTRTVGSVVTYYNVAQSLWDVSNVTNMSYMFRGTNLLDETNGSTISTAPFGSHFNRWDVSNVTDMSYMFSQVNVYDGSTRDWGANSDFNRYSPVNGWDVSSLVNASYMFADSKWENEIHWSNTQNIENFEGMFSNCSNFGAPLRANSWDGTFSNDFGTIDIQPTGTSGIERWNTSSATNMSRMFQGCEDFNRDLSRWVTTNVTDMSFMFDNAVNFGRVLPAVTGVAPRPGFPGAGTIPFDGTFFEGINTKDSEGVRYWDVSNVTNMSYMFRNNGNEVGGMNFELSNWDTSSVTNMESMFRNTFVFNNADSDGIGNWNTSNVTNMNNMFQEARAFDQDLSNWDTSSLQTAIDFSLDADQRADNSDSEGNWIEIEHPLGDSDIANHEAPSGRLGRWPVITLYPLDGDFGTSVPVQSDWINRVGNDIGYRFVNGEGIYTDEPITDASNMFQYRNLSALNDGGLERWDTSTFTNMSRMFDQVTRFNYDISSWDVSNVTDMSRMFNGDDFNPGEFNQDLSSWDVSSVTNMSGMFASTEFNNGGSDGIRNWDVSNVTDMSFMFINTQSYDQPLNDWDVSNVENMRGMFTDSSYNQPLNNWNTSSVTNMINMFRGAWMFNQPISNFDTSNVTSMSFMFNGASDFNQDIGNWDTSSVTSMREMFRNADAFNQPINGWDVSSVTDMRGMFRDMDIFNRPLDNWDVTNVTRMDEMFRSAVAFNQDLSRWCVENIPDEPTRFDLGADVWTLPRPNWGDACMDCDSILNAADWDEVIAQDPRFASVDTNLRRFYPASNATSEPTSDVWESSDWGGNGAGNDFFYFLQGSGIYTNTPIINMSSMFSDRTFIDPDIACWDTSTVTDMSYMFGQTRARAWSSESTPIGMWDVSNVRNMEGMFSLRTGFNENLGSWDVSNVENMSLMFSSSENFNNGDSNSINNWNTSSLTNMQQMFANAFVFNQPIGGWDTSNVTDMSFVFRSATVFNQPIGSWDTSSVETMQNMFNNAQRFNQDLGWNTSNVTNMSAMFFSANDFNNGDSDSISYWDVSNVTDMGSMFNNAGDFNQDLILWCVTNIPSAPTNFDRNTDNWFMNRPFWGMCFMGRTLDQLNTASSTFFPLSNTETDPTSTSWRAQNSGYVFTPFVGIRTATPMTNAQQMFSANSTFNDPDVTLWDTSNITNMLWMFRNAAAFNQPIGGWDTSSVESMQNMFNNASAFNQDIGGWNTSNVTSMSFMFSNADAFNQDIGNWNISNVENTSYMFDGADVFNQDIGGWDTSSVTFMEGMFRNATVFNQDISGWNTSNVTGMNRMFLNAEAFNQDLFGWCVELILSEPADFDDGAAAWTEARPNWGAVCP